MKRKLSMILAMVLIIVATLLPSVVFAAEAAEEEVELAQSTGQAFIKEIADTNSDFLEWKDARLAASQPCYDLEGQVIAYMFAVQENDTTVGHIVVGSGSYDYPIFQAGKSPPPSVPPADKVKSSLEKDLGLEVDEESILEPTHLVYLGLGGFCATYEIEGQMVVIDLISTRAILTSDIKSNIPSPQEYKAGKKEIAESKPESLGSSGYKTLSAMTVWNDCDNPPCYCGPCTGVSIGDYYRDRTDRPEYDDLYGNEVMYDRLFDLMEADIFGGAVLPWGFGPGFVVMTMECGYEDPTVFGYDHDEFVLPDDYWNTVDDIDHGWPSGLLFVRIDKAHWIGIKGYYYSDTESRIRCTDISAPPNQQPDEVWYDWLWGPGIHVVCIYPEDVAGVTREVNCTALSGVTVELSKSGWQGSATSDEDGYYELAVPETGTYDVVASKSGFRDESEEIDITDLEEVYELDFLAQTGLVPNEASVFYVLECINQRCSAYFAGENKGWS